MAITDLTGTKWLLNESFTTMPNGDSFTSGWGSGSSYTINFVSNSNSYTYVYTQDDDYPNAGIFYNSFCVWDLTSWISQNYRTIEIIDGEDVTNTELIAWLETNATQIVIPTGYTITFDTDGGSAVSALTEQTTLPSPLPTTTKANHVFAGWYYDNLFTQKANAGDELTANVTLYAKWYTPATWCEDIADAIREKDGTIEPIKHLDFPERIRALEIADSDPLITVHGLFTFKPSGSTAGTVTWNIPSALLDKLYCYRYSGGSHYFYKLSNVYLVGSSVSSTVYASKLNTATGSFTRNVSTNGNTIGFCPHNYPPGNVSPGIVGLLCIMPPDESVGTYTYVSFTANNGALVDMKVKKCEIPKSLLDQYYPGFNESMIKRFDIYAGAIRLANNDGW